MRIVLLGDVHVSINTLQPWRWLSKRAVGQLNALMNPQRRFEVANLPAVVERAASLRPDLVLLSGDLTTTSLPEEFRVAGRALAPLTGAFPTLAVAGNHDVYTLGASLFHRMQRLLPGLLPEQFPHARAIAQGWHVLAVNSSVARLWSSRGRIGKTQMAALRKNLAALSEDEGVIVLTHYSAGKPMSLDPRVSTPVAFGLHGPDEGSRVRPQRWSHQMEDQDEFLRALGDCRARVLLMHGHIHRPWIWRRPEPGLEHVLDINAGAPVLLSDSFPCGQGFWEFELPVGRGPAAEAPIVARHHLPMPAENSAGAGEPSFRWTIRLPE